MVRGQQDRQVDSRVMPHGHLTAESGQVLILTSDPVGETGWAGSGGQWGWGGHGLGLPRMGVFWDEGGNAKGQSGTWTRMGLGGHGVRGLARRDQQGVVPRLLLVQRTGRVCGKAFYCGKPWVGAEAQGKAPPTGGP